LHQPARDTINSWSASGCVYWLNSDSRPASDVERVGGGLTVCVGGADKPNLVVVPAGHGVAIGIGLLESHFVKSGELTPTKTNECDPNDMSHVDSYEICGLVPFGSVR
jgi:hypothetical protein